MDTYTEDNIDLEKLKVALVNDTKIDLLEASFSLKKVIDVHAINDKRKTDDSDFSLHPESRFLYIYQGTSSKKYSFRRNKPEDISTYKSNNFKELKLSDFKRQTKTLFNDIWS